MHCWNGNPQEHHTSQLAITTAAEEQQQLQQEAPWNWEEYYYQQVQLPASAPGGPPAWKLEADAINAAWRELQFQAAERALTYRERHAYVDNVVPGEPAPGPHHPEATDIAMGWEFLDSEAVAGERAAEPHQQGTRSEIMQGQWHGPGRQAEYYRRTKRRRLWYQPRR